MHAKYVLIVLRVGKPLEHIQAAMKALLSSAKSGEKATTVLRQVSYAAYLFFDMLAWVRLTLSSALL